MQNTQKDILEFLNKRIGKSHLEKRLKMQREHAADVYNRGGITKFHPENLEPMMIALDILLKITFLKKHAVKNSLDIRIEKNDILSGRIPQKFHGFTILQLSDIHIDGYVDGGEKLCEIIRRLSYDLCVITGDFRYLTHGDYDRCVLLTKKLVRSISCRHGVVAILGNHDFIEIVPGIESEGVTFLINDNKRISREGQSIVLAGVDDSHMYGTDDLPKALSGISNHEFTILLAHSPSIYRKAASMKVDCCLSGHSHGGQVCLPGGIALMTNTNAPRKYIAGPWTYHNLKGYTSRGTGSSGLPARLFCPPEITLHRLLLFPV
ncbi:MAG: metallophosphoesterase [Candidatus Latescibacteria bacterium]|nr:metallophosphoesterase [Candidatus Latescibacterota bacterium]